MKYVNIGYSMKLSEAKRAADLLRRNSRKVQMRAGDRKSERRLVVRLKRGEKAYPLQKELERRVRALFNLSMTKEQRAEAVEKASETRLHNTCTEKLGLMRRGLLYEIRRDFTFAPKSNRKQRIEKVPRKKGAWAELFGYGRYYTEGREDGNYAVFAFSMIVSRSIALAVIEKYQHSPRLFSIRTEEPFRRVERKRGVVTRGSIVLSFEYEVPVESVGEVHFLEKSYDELISGFTRPLNKE